MTGSDQSMPNVPPGIDPEVQARIDTLLAQHLTANSNSNIAGEIRNNGGIGSCVGVSTTALTDILDGHTNNSTESPTSQPIVNVFQPRVKIDKDNDAGIRYEGVPRAGPPLSPQHAVLHLSDRSEASRSNTPPYQVVTGAFPLTQSISVLPLPPPNTSPPQATLFKRTISYIGNYFSASPEIIEYSDAEIKTKTQVCVKAQKRFVSNVPTQDLVVKVAAVLIEMSPTGANSGDYGLVERPVEILAKHKRVREIKRGLGCFVVEDVYRKEIRVALARLNR
ncbi:hypothetical protein AA0111_g4671 [Alternaria arborescens]|uniref:hypothetical protein n=1 Tax=Alternaria arborescens TaxID=156630 RepID=UPI001074F042|nr:hypothetical protein AA0111_g4671 [Alternaria arborescens]RYO31628.1 hypothetical protein AA0111_g4671 [Alternaria arborescens]